MFPTNATKLCRFVAEGQDNAKINQRSAETVWSGKTKRISTFGRRLGLPLEILDSRDSDVCVKSFVIFPGL